MYGGGEHAAGIECVQSLTIPARACRVGELCENALAYFAGQTHQDPLADLSLTLGSAKHASCLNKRRVIGMERLAAKAAWKLKLAHQVNTD